MEHWIVSPKVMDGGHTASASTGASVEVAVIEGEGVRLPLTSFVAVGDAVAVSVRAPTGVAVAVESSVAVGVSVAVVVTTAVSVGVSVEVLDGVSVGVVEATTVENVAVAVSVSVGVLVGVLTSSPTPCDRVSAGEMAKAGIG